MKKLTNKKGFTLTELIVVIVIIGILAAVLIPSLTQYISKAKASAAEQNAQSAVTEYIATLANEDMAYAGQKRFYVAEYEKWVVAGVVEDVTLADTSKAFNATTNGPSDQKDFYVLAADGTCTLYQYGTSCYAAAGTLSWN